MGRAKGYQSKGCQPSGAKGQKGSEKGRVGKVVEKVNLKVGEVITSVS